MFLIKHFSYLLAARSLSCLTGKLYLKKNYCKHIVSTPLCKIQSQTSVSNSFTPNLCLCQVLNFYQKQKCSTGALELEKFTFLAVLSPPNIQQSYLRMCPTIWSGKERNIIAPIPKIGGSEQVKPQSEAVRGHFSSCLNRCLCYIDFKLPT